MGGSTLMGRRRRGDAIDLACRAWADKRRLALGLDDPREAREYLGAIRCTLGQRRDLHAGSTSYGRVEQHWPECYCEDDGSLAVYRAYRNARLEMKRILDIHYLIHLPAKVKAETLAMSEAKYWRQVELARTFVEAWMLQSA